MHCDVSDGRFTAPARIRRLIFGGRKHQKLKLSASRADGANINCSASFSSSSSFLLPRKQNSTETSAELPHSDDNLYDGLFNVLFADQLFPLSRIFEMKKSPESKIHFFSAVSLKELSTTTKKNNPASSVMTHDSPVSLCS